MATKQLDGSYQQTLVLDMKKDKKLFWLLNAASLVMLIAFFLVPVPMPEMPIVLDSANLLLALVCFIAGCVIVMALHELVHGIFIRRFTHDKVTYGFHGAFASAGSPHYYFSKREYNIVALAPFVLLNLLLFVLLFVFNGSAFLLCYLVCGVHFSGCAGDLYVVIRLLRFPPTTMIQDSGIRMVFYQPE